MNRNTFRVYTFLALVFLAGDVVPDEKDKDVWIFIDTGKSTLTVLQDSSIRRVYRNISIGRGGVGFEKRTHDGKTPLGDFHISRISSDSPFHRFFALDYPTLEHAKRAVGSGAIGQKQYLRIRQALQSKKRPPQDTPLGGYIGIHGVGNGDRRIHQDFNWTNGCIALTNEQIDELALWVHIGTPVVIR